MYLHSVYDPTYSKERVSESIMSLVRHTVGVLWVFRGVPLVSLRIKGVVFLDYTHCLKYKSK